MTFSGIQPERLCENRGKEIEQHRPPLVLCGEIACYNSSVNYRRTHGKNKSEIKVKKNKQKQNRLNYTHTATHTCTFIESGAAGNCKQC